MASPTSAADAIDRLVGLDPALAAVVGRWGRPEVFRRPPGFATLILLVLEQQVSLSSAAAAFRRLRETTGGVRPDTVIALDDESLRRVGFSRQKSRYARTIAATVLDGSLDLESMPRMGDDDVRTALMRVAGIGAWTADIYLMASLDRPDVWPVGDRALRVGTGEVLSLPAVPDLDELAVIGERWRPHRSTAARLIWHDYLSRRGRVAPVAAVEP